jgi:hypothetical protein
VKKAFDAVVTTGEYQDRQTGKTKKQYRTIGAVFQNDEGKLSLKLELLPTVGFNGWINFYPPREGDQKPKQAAPSDDDFGDSNIPF